MSRHSCTRASSGALPVPPPGGSAVSRPAIISAAFYGTEGGVALHNVNGSFYDFTAERYRGTATETLSRPPDAWGGRAAAEWATRLAAGVRFDAGADRLVTVAQVIDRIYGR